jgi:hypothetical protein
MSPQVIFTFWEPKNKIIPYLDLCRKTWEIQSPGYEIITLDYSNLFDYIDKFTYDFQKLKDLPLMMQKDAVMVALLQQRGGLFLDIDTLVFRDITAFLDKLKDTEVVMFSTHIGCIAARAGARVMSSWMEGIQSRINKLTPEQFETAPGWDFIGNSVLTEVMDDMVREITLERLFENRLVNLSPTSYEPSITGIGQTTQSKVSFLSRARKSFIRRKRLFFFKIFYRKYFLMLDRIKSGFMMELDYFQTKKMTTKEKYLNFWFDCNVDIDIILNKNPMVIGLHNSFTPEEYKTLNEREVLEEDYLLSKTLNYLLSGQPRIEGIR